ncbi:nucleotidyl transferase AbiEii/AbiGii toxin family protein [Jatrophihabitans sp.]|jgi:hypothetical protein|uniref:nucleotidyl transferase AbiEii/AbiGii toxin family protein n=1 Tax=Jatrophihabitans sp. TaxID=1932789 RepID=UPI002F1EB6A8
MSRPPRGTAAGRAYLDLQSRARAEGRGTQELLTLYVVERWLARLSASPYRDQFVLKGGMLLAAFDARRPTADVDVQARDFAMKRRPFPESRPWLVTPCPMTVSSSIWGP